MICFDLWKSSRIILFFIFFNDLLIMRLGESHEPDETSRNFMLKENQHHLKKDDQ